MDLFAGRLGRKNFIIGWLCMVGLTVLLFVSIIVFLASFGGKEQSARDDMQRSAQQSDQLLQERLQLIKDPQ